MGKKKGCRREVEGVEKEKQKKGEGDIMDVGGRVLLQKPISNGAQCEPGRKPHMVSLHRWGPLQGEE